jgi:hypothetical protein
VFPDVALKMPQAPDGFPTVVKVTASLWTGAPRWVTVATTAVCAPPIVCGLTTETPTAFRTAVWVTVAVALLPELASVTVIVHVPTTVVAA